jgi:hypothetical protein
MPVISMFYGLIIAMYYLDTKQHNLPHIHVKYSGIEAVLRNTQWQTIRRFVATQ